MSKQPSELWHPVGIQQETLPLEFTQAKLQQKIWKDIAALPDMEYLDKFEWRTTFKQVQYVIAAKVKETLANDRGETKVSERIVGILWGEVLPRLRDVLEIDEVAADPAYGFVVEEWMFDRLRAAMPTKGWRHLVIRAPHLEPHSYPARLAERHDFINRDVKDGEVIWQWPADDNGIEPATTEAL